MASDTRERMLQTTARLLQHRGYYGTTMNGILEESGAPRGSLYFHFPGGKDELVIEATRRSVDQATADLRHVLAAADNPAQAVRLFVEGAAQILSDSDYTYGCPVAPVILDATGDLEELAALCREAFETWVDLLHRAFVDAGIPDERAHGLAVLVESAIEGLLLIGRAYRDCGPLVTVAAELEATILAAMPGAGRRRAAGSD